MRATRILNDNNNLSTSKPWIIPLGDSSHFAYIPNESFGTSSAVTACQFTNIRRMDQATENKQKNVHDEETNNLISGNRNDYQDDRWVEAVRMKAVIHRYQMYKAASYFANAENQIIDHFFFFFGCPGRGRETNITWISNFKYIYNKNMKKNNSWTMENFEFLKWKTKALFICIDSFCGNSIEIFQLFCTSIHIRLMRWRGDRKRKGNNETGK